MDLIKFCGLCIVSLSLVGCASLPTSSKGMYGPSPDALATGSANQERRVISPTLISLIQSMRFERR